MLVACSFCTRVESLAPGQWKQPKFYELGQYALCLEALGSADVVSSGWGERSHKEVKAAFRFTNKHNATVQRQVGLLPGHDTRRLNHRQLVLGCQSSKSCRSVSSDAFCLSMTPCLTLVSHHP